MKTVIVTGIGALIGQGIINAINNLSKRDDVKLIGIDRNGNTHARFLCDEFVKKCIVDESSEEYLGFWLDLVAKERVDLILPGIEDDVIFFNQHRDDLPVNLPALLNSRSTLSIGLDKYKLFKFACANNVLAIPTTLATDFEFIDSPDVLESKIIIKPRSSNGSRGMLTLQDIDEVQAFLKGLSIEDLNKLIIQPYIGSDAQEYTVSIFGFDDGTYQGPIAFKRLLSSEGFTKYAKTVDPPDEILTSIDIVAKECMPIGPTNFQFRKHNNRYYLMEINPRFSSTTSMKAAFGFDEVQMSLQYFFYGQRRFNLSVHGGEAWRYTSDFIKYR